jgi:hypothetical protein
MWGLCIAGAYITAGSYMAYNQKPQSQVQEHSHMRAHGLKGEQDSQRERQQFLKFMATYGKTYAGQEEEMEGRFEIFQENLQTIEKHNARHSTFELGVNQFSDMSETEFSDHNMGIALPALK